MPGRQWSNGSAYRYGFNGKENDNEVKGEGNQQDYGMRIYDPRVGRFLSVDPLAKQYPYFSPYHFAGNSPLQAIDLDGAEPKGFHPKNPYVASHPGAGATHIASAYDQAVLPGSIIGQPGAYVSGYAIRDIDKKYYVVYEDAHGIRNWYREYDKNGWKGNVNSFEWSSPPDPSGLLRAITIIPIVAVPAAVTYGLGVIKVIEKVVEEKSENQNPEREVDSRGSELTESYNKTKDPTMDCSDLAKSIYEEVPGGNIYQLTPKSGRTFDGVEYNEVVDFRYHQFFKKDNYVYDPMFSNKPVKFDDFIKKYNDLNPGGYKMEVIK